MLCKLVTTTPVTDDNVTVAEACSTVEQAVMSELEKMKEEHVQSQTELFNMCGRLYDAQKSQEKQLAGLRHFARNVELFLDQLDRGAPAPEIARPTLRSEEGSPRVSQAYVPGVSASSSMGPNQIPRPPTISAPLVPSDTATTTGTGNPSPEPNRGRPTTFSTVKTAVRSGAIRIDITDPDQWTVGDTTILRNQEAKKVRDIGSLIFETPIQHDYEASTEVRSLLPNERLEEMGGHLAVTDDDPQNPGVRRVRFWVDESANTSVDARSHGEGERCQLPEGAHMAGTHVERDQTRGSPDFGGEHIIGKRMLNVGNPFPRIIAHHR